MFYSKPASGTGGAGMSGLLQGMMAGQQSRATDQKMKMLQTNFDRQQDDIEKNDFNSKLYELETVQNNGGNVAPMLVNFNKGFSKLNNFKDTKFSVQNVNDFKNEDGSFRNEFINKYKADTGKDWVPGSADAGNYVDKHGSQVMFSGADGQSKVFDPDTFTAGSSNYKNYKEQKNLQRRLQEAQISKALGTSDEGPTYAELKNLKDNGQLPDSMVPMFKASQEKAKRAEGDAQDTLSTRPFEENIKNISDGGQLGDGYKKALQLEQQSGNKYSNKTLDDQITAYKDMSQVKSDVTELVKSGVNMGATKGYASEAAKYSKNYDDMSDTEKQKQLNTIVMKSKIGGLVSRYLKAMSGTAVTEEEFNRQLENIVGGDISKLNSETVLAAMQATVDDVGKSVGDQIGAIEPQFPASKMWRLDRMNQAKRTKPAQQPKITKTGGTKGVEEVGIEAVGDESKAALDFGSQAAKSLLTKVFSGDATPEEEEQLKKMPGWKQMAVKMGLMDAPKVETPLPKKVPEAVSNSKDEEFFKKFKSIADLKAGLPNLSEDQKAYFDANKRQIKRYILKNTKR